jgi:hypothetical protein
VFGRACRIARAHIDEEHKVTLDAALAHDGDPVVNLITNTWRRRCVASKPSSPTKVPNRPRSTRRSADGSPPGDALPGR